MEIPGLSPHSRVCESDCGATVLLPAKASRRGWEPSEPIPAPFLRGSFIAAQGWSWV